MAHCIHLEDEEIQLFKERGVGIAHCPHSNIKLVSLYFVSEFVTLLLQFSNTFLYSNSCYSFKYYTMYGTLCQICLSDNNFLKTMRCSKIAGAK